MKNPVMTGLWVGLVAQYLGSIIPNHLNQVFSNYEAPLDHPHLIRMYL